MFYHLTKYKQFCDILYLDRKSDSYEKKRKNNDRNCINFGFSYYH